MAARSTLFTLADLAPVRRAGPLMSLLDLYRQRRALARMEACQLRDLGLTRQQAQAEARRPIWDVPAHWRT